MTLPAKMTLSEPAATQFSRPSKSISSSKRFAKARPTTSCACFSIKPRAPGSIRCRARSIRSSGANSATANGSRCARSKRRSTGCG